MKKDKKIYANLNDFMPDLAKTESFSRKADLNYTDGNTTRVPLNWQDPLYEPSIQLFPEYDLTEANRRYRNYYKHNPIVSNCVDILSTFPLSDFQLLVDDEEIKEYYNYIKDKLKLLKMSEHNLRDKALLGESIHLGNWDQENMEWSEWYQYPPEFVEITTIPGTSKKVYTIKPDPEISKILKEQNETSIILSEVLKKTNNKYLEAAQNEEGYVIPEKRVMYIANMVNGYSKRGYALTKRALLDLNYEQNIRGLQNTFVQRHMFPIKIFKLGSENLGWVPSKKHFTQFKKLLTQAASDPDMSLIYHFGLQVDYVGTKDKIENLIPHFEFCAKRIMNAFFCNEALINGEAPSYAGQTANMRMLMYRFNTEREDLQLEYQQKIFLPIARQQELVRQTEGEVKKLTKVKSKSFATKKYYLPEFLWQKQNLVNNTQEQQFLMTLYQNGDIPFSIIAEVFGLSKKSIEYYRKIDNGTYSNQITREIVDQTIKEDPSLSLAYVLGEDPIQIMKKKLQSDKKVEEQEQMNKDMGMPEDNMSGGGFDSSAPLDLGGDEGGSSEELGEEPMSETGEGSDNIPAPAGEESAPLE
ncbi:MAG: hypothetical protein NC222_06230 [Staphylococcus sp.]|nr:hypothetical protein [Staphylococcus sp.]